MKSYLNARMEIAFYNVIDHRCDRMEERGLSAKEICTNIKGYTERFIAGHEMTESKEKELRDFTETICRIVSTPPKT